MRSLRRVAAIGAMFAIAGCTVPKHDTAYYLHHDAERKAELARCGGNTADAECVAATDAQITLDQTNPKALHALDKKL